MPKGKDCGLERDSVSKALANRTKERENNRYHVVGKV